MTEFYCDGSAKGGLGGWAFVDGVGAGTAGAVPRAAANAMELAAVVAALRSLPAEPGVRVTVHTDSVYVIVGARTWRHVGWPAWDALYFQLETHAVTFVKVHRRSPHPLHTKAHHLAREAAFGLIAQSRVTR